MGSGLSARSWGPTVSLPITDWQFWVVTAAAAFAASWLLRGLIGRIIRRGKARRPVSRRAVLTISGKPVK